MLSRPSPPHPSPPPPSNPGDAEMLVDAGWGRSRKMGKPGGRGQTSARDIFKKEGVNFIPCASSLRSMSLLCPGGPPPADAFPAGSIAQPRLPHAAQTTMTSDSTSSASVPSLSLNY